MHLISGSSGRSAGGSRPLSALAPGQQGTVERVVADGGDRHDRLVSLGVTPGAPVTVLQIVPSIVFVCDQTELAVEREVADAILVTRTEV
jgi:Fe2+ transport system protein FeoA